MATAGLVFLLFSAHGSAWQHQTVTTQIEEKPMKGSTHDADTLTIPINAQATVDDVRVAPFNVREEAKRGASPTRKTVAFEVVSGEDESHVEKHRLGEGETFRRGNLVFRVVAIAEDEVKLSVTRA
jgi:hypothetical protein